MRQILVFYFLFFYCYSLAQVSLLGKTEIIKKGQKFELIRNGQPYYVKGAGGTEYLDILKSIGGNSIRTWSTENAQIYLDRAHEQGISVCLGLWAGHERHGFDYNDEYAVAAQLQSFKQEILKYKNHPALLMWAVGNEVDLFYTNFRVWEAIGEIAKMIKEIDPNHPVMTVTAGIDPSEVSMIKNYCPDIDLLGINTYGGIKDLSSMVKKYGWEKPYMVTEWGPYGHWESPITSWGVAIEATSKKKAEFRKEAYKAIQKDSILCLGSYAFLWGYKQEQTPTWYGLFTRDGRATQSIDVLNNFWNGQVRNYAPIIHSFNLNEMDPSSSVKVKKKRDCIFTFNVTDIDDDKLTYHFELMPESEDKKAGGDFEKTPESIDFKIIAKSLYLGVRSDGEGITASVGPKEKNIFLKKNNELVIEAPSSSGAYRFFIYVYDDDNNVATANFPFYVK